VSEEIDRAIGQFERRLARVLPPLTPLQIAQLISQERLEELRRQRQAPSAAAPVADVTALQVRLAGPPGMKVARFVPAGEGKKPTQSNTKEAPCRFNAPLGQTMRLKLYDIPNRPGLALYPTLEVMPATPKTAAFLANTFANLTFTNEDLDQVAAGRLVTKVIYLKGAEGGEPDELASPRLEPGVDPIAEAGRRGPLLMVVRLGGIDLEAGSR
jgi:hypothetical protein